MPLSFFHKHFIGNYANQSELLREQYVQNVTIIQNDVQLEIRNASRAMWACDPNDFSNQGNHNNILCNKHHIFSISPALISNHGSI